MLAIDLVIIHGGPGINTHQELHDAFIPTVFEKTAIRSVLFYDQLGCGLSDKPSQGYSMDRFVVHLSQIIAQLDYVVLFGYSFGG